MQGELILLSATKSIKVYKRTAIHRVGRSKRSIKFSDLNRVESRSDFRVQPEKRNFAEALRQISEYSKTVETRIFFFSPDF